MGVVKKLKEPRGEKYGSDKGFVQRSAMTLTIDKDTWFKVTANPLPSSQVFLIHYALQKPNRIGRVWGG